METPVQTCTRLVTALEALTAEEAANVQNRDFTAVVEIQRRASPLVEHLVVHGPRVADEKLRDRIAAVVAQRQQSVAQLSQEIESARERLRELDTQQRRVARIGPAYRAANAHRSRLSAIG